jgi:hypothetical protein
VVEDPRRAGQEENSNEMVSTPMQSEKKRAMKNLRALRDKVKQLKM